MPTKRHPRAVTFDLDGLMLNTEELYQYVGHELLRRRGRAFTGDLLDAMMGRPNAIAYRTMIDWHDLEDTPEALGVEADEIFDLILEEHLALMPGLLRLLDALESVSVPKAIATSSPPSFVERVLKPFDLAPRFEFVLTSEDVSQGKPNPEIYMQAAARFGITAAEMAVLEDSQAGCTAAAASGALTIAVPAGHSRRQDFSVADLEAKSLADRRLYAALGLRPS